MLKSSILLGFHQSAFAKLLKRLHYPTATEMAGALAQAEAPDALKKDSQTK